jgi:hypothetical protein
MKANELQINNYMTKNKSKNKFYNFVKFFILILDENI